MYGSDKVQGLTPWICQSLFKRASDYKDDTSFRAEVRYALKTKNFHLLTKVVNDTLTL